MRRGRTITGTVLSTVLGANGESTFTSRWISEISLQGLERDRKVKKY